MFREKKERADVDMPVWVLYNISLLVLNPAEGDRVSHGKRNSSEKSLPRARLDITLVFDLAFSTHMALAPAAASSDFSSPHPRPIANSTCCLPLTSLDMSSKEQIINLIKL